MLGVSVDNRGKALLSGGELGPKVAMSNSASEFSGDFLSPCRTLRRQIVLALEVSSRC
jgi:hypothetical protein